MRRTYIFLLALIHLASCASNKSVESKPGEAYLTSEDLKCLEQTMPADLGAPSTVTALKREENKTWVLKEVFLFQKLTVPGAAPVTVGYKIDGNRDEFLKKETPRASLVCRIGSSQLVSNYSLPTKITARDVVVTEVIKGKITKPDVGEIQQEILYGFNKFDFFQALLSDAKTGIDWKFYKKSETSVAVSTRVDFDQPNFKGSTSLVYFYSLLSK